MSLSRMVFRILVCWALSAGAFAQNDAAVGAGIFSALCTQCHEPTLFRGMSSERILNTLNNGAMEPFAAPLSPEQRQAVADFLGSSATRPGLPASAYCADRSVTFDSATLRQWNGWSPDGRNMRYQDGLAAGLTADQVNELQLRWAFGFDQDLSSFSQPAVFDNQVFVGSSAGVVYALQADSGCIQWRFENAGPVRTAILVADTAAGRVVLFGDQLAWFYAVDAATGKLRWRVRMDEHQAARLTGSPTLHGNTVFVPVSSWEETLESQPSYPCCTFRGSVSALNLDSGTSLWKTYLVDAPHPITSATSGRQLWGPSGAGVWSAPTIDDERGLLYVTTGNNYTYPASATSDAVVALDQRSGEIRWTRQMTPGDIFPYPKCDECVGDQGPDFDFGSSAILVGLDDGRDILLAGQKSGVVYALDPDNKGEILWETRVAEGSTHGGIQWGMATDGRYLFAPIADGELVYVRGDDGVSRRIMPSDEGGGLAALNVADGSVAWQAAPARVCAGIPNCSPAQLAAASAIPGVVFSGALDGHLRAYSTEDGRVLWDVDTRREYQTVNGVIARGGALNGNGPVIAGGRVFVNSGYNHFGTIAGNVLLMFSIEEN
ncbi:MAG: PQQ-binding-like beta-propeller repeat protein [Pseudomonadales bacterium]|nr:PQQ-binding-like beta-propeller repeat protein [Pseudomonadales bacterium]